MRNRHLQPSTRNMSGFTVIELLIVIAIMIVATIVIVNRVQSARQSATVNSEAGNLSAIVSKTLSSFAGRPNYDKLTTAYLLAQNAFPSQMVNSGVVTHSWNGAVTITPSASKTSFDISYADVPTAACIELVSNVSRTYNEVTIEATATKSGADVADLTLTETACKSSPLVKITFNAS